MLTTIITVLVTAGLGYVADRWKYGRDAIKTGLELARVAEAAGLPHAGDARKIAEQAIIQRNLVEADRVAREIERQKAAAPNEWRESVKQAERDARAKREGK